MRTQLVTFLFIFTYLNVMGQGNITRHKKKGDVSVNLSQSKSNHSVKNATVKYCDVCGKTLNNCLYGGHHRVCPDCGKIEEKCEYLGVHPKYIDKTYNDGSSYKGYVWNGEFNGQGTFRSADKSVYTGDFVDGKAHGKGTMIYSNGDVYEGNWFNGMKNGQGTYYWADKSCMYEGEFKNNKRCGNGTITFSNNLILKSLWSDDKEIKRQDDNRAKILENTNVIFGTNLPKLPKPKKRGANEAWYRASYNRATLIENAIKNELNKYYVQ